ncbi:hypothetical protein HMPREF3293_02958 [Christensenella minuta]|uniref:Uncharacterized protein n=1 Tax=Christensenella minuta TaxID=626937 RepID=A0A136Q0U3_9FIRM|nr:hypothetical protein HMPREF3293_02958 [Christensenella minuta]
MYPSYVLFIIPFQKICVKPGLCPAFAPLPHTAKNRPHLDGRPFLFSVTS